MAWSMLPLPLCCVADGATGGGEYRAGGRPGLAMMALVAADMVGPCAASFCRTGVS